VVLDETTDEILRRVAEPGQEAAYVRAAIIEKAARDEQRSELDQLRERVARLEAELARLRKRA
jgi:polyhydroxyalkanoate synthesis regulator phasin